MKKLALVHKGWFSATAVTDRWRLLFEAIRTECGFDLAFIEQTKRVPADTDVLFFSCAAGHLDNSRIRSLYHGYVGKRILYLGDYHPEQRPATSAIEKADLVLAPEAQTYRKRFPDKRVEFFPYFFAPQERYTQLAWNDSPRMRCLISGPITANYPLRLAASKSRLAEILPHAGSHGAQKKGAVVRDAYAQALNRYFCAVAGSLRGGITTKTFEIMAAGALCLTDPIEDMKEAGLRVWEHYVPVGADTIADRIKLALEDKAEGDKIRRAGMVYARERHSIRNRIGQFRALMETL
jgi:hypothetical protein